MTSTKISQTVKLRQTKGATELKIRNIFKPLAQIQNNFTELFLMVPSTKIARMVLLRQTKGLAEL